MKKVINTPLAPTPGGHFSQGIVVNGRIYVAGQTPINPKTGEMPESIEEKTRQCITNIENVLMEGGGKLEDVVKVNIYLTNIDDFEKVNEVYKEFFTGIPPVRVTCGVQLKGIPIEIDAIAEIDGSL